MSQFFDEIHEQPQALEKTLRQMGRGEEPYSG